MHIFRAMTLTLIVLSHFRYIVSEGLAAICPKVEIEWAEIHTRYFAVIYPKGSDSFGPTITTLFGEELDNDFAIYTALFKSLLKPPIAIRIYPNDNQYQCLNPLAVELPQSIFFTHVGLREIALIRDKINTSEPSWKEIMLNALRHELVVLIADQLTGGKSPPGLLAGLGVYAEDPEFSVGSREFSGTNVTAPTRSWRDLWESSAILLDRGGAIQAMTIVAYLIDVYGWQTFHTFLVKLSLEGSYRKALASVYKVEFTELERHWKTYYPIYFEGRWRANIFYDFDLTVFEELISSGAYTDAAAGLKEAIAFLDTIGESRKAQQARDLLSITLMGKEAGSLVNQTRQALLEKKYNSVIILAEQAEKKYLEIGYLHRIDEITTYRSWAQEVLELRSEINKIKTDLNMRNESEAIPRLIQIGTRLNQLQDEKGGQAVTEVLRTIEEQRRHRFNLISLYGILICIFLLTLRIGLMGRKPPPETRLM